MQGVKGEAVVKLRRTFTIRQRRTSAADAVSSAFPKGKQQGEHRMVPGPHHIQDPVGGISSSQRPVAANSGNASALLFMQH
jgi:hypothetical protein